MRDEPWSRLTTGLSDQNIGQGQVVMVVTGLGGCGKTQLVTKFAHEHNDRYGKFYQQLMILISIQIQPDISCGWEL
jgi:hypothetical protein